MAIKALIIGVQTLNNNYMPNEYDRYIKSTEEELGALQIPQKQITPATVPTGLIDRGGTTYTVDLATGNLVPLGAEFREDINRRRIGEESAQRQGLYGQQIQRQLGADIEEEKRRLTSAISAQTGGRAIESLGFSSAELGVLSAISDASQRRIKDLERSAQQALSKFNLEEYSRAKAEISDERKATREREATLFSRLISLKEAKTAEDKTKIASIVGANIDSLPQDKQVLVLPNGQQISPDDPNIEEYKKAPGATIKTIPGDVNAFYDKLAQQYGVDRNALESAFVASKKEKVKPIELSPGATLVDENGNVLYTAPAKEEKTTDQRNYEAYAVDEKNAGKTPLSFNDWLTMDANRKRAITNVGVGGTSMTAGQIASFNQVVSKYQASPLVKADDRAIVLKTLLPSLQADPTNSSLQLSFIYSFIQALDTYQSAVREGEISLLGATQGLADKIRNLPNKIAGGSVLSTDKINQYIKTAELLVNSISAAATKKKGEYGSQATVSGVGDAWNSYISLSGGSAPVGQIGKYTPGTVINYQGKQYKVGNDGDTLTPI